MDFLRWVIFEKIMRNCDPGDVFAGFFISTLITGLLTALFWPFGVILALIWLIFWGIVAYAIGHRVYKDLYQEYQRGK